MNKIVFIALITLTAAAVVDAQIAQGGAYSIEQSVIANGGGTSADSGNVYKLVGAIGQAVAGTTSTNSPFTLSGGFFNAPQLFAPTAAMAAIEGRVRKQDGTGIRNVVITLTEANGTIRTTDSGVGGFYRFDDVETGQTVFLSASAKRFVFSQPVQVLNLTEEATQIDFVVSQQNIRSEMTVREKL